MIVSPSGASNSISSGRTVTFGIAFDQFSICSLGKLQIQVGPTGRFAIIHPLYHARKELSKMVPKNGAVEPFVPVAGYTITVRAQYPNKPGMLGRLATTIGEAGGDIGAVDIVRTNSTRDR